MSQRLLLDTDVVVDYLRGLSAAIRYLESRTETLLVSAITVAELFAGVRGGEEQSALSAFLGAFEVVPVDEAIARRAGLLRSSYGKSHNTGLADALVAATALETSAQLITMNLKHYPMLAGLRSPYTK